RLPEAGWDGDPPLVVHHVLEVPAKHPIGRRGRPHNPSPNNRHAPPLPTAARGYTPRARRLSRRLPPVGLKRKPRAALPRAARGPGRAAEPRERWTAARVAREHRTGPREANPPGVVRERRGGRGARRGRARVGPQRA